MSHKTTIAAFVIGFVVGWLYFVRKLKAAMINEPNQVVDAVHNIQRQKAREKFDSDYGSK